MVHDGGGSRRILHHLHDSRADTVLLQIDQIVRLQSRGCSVNADVVDDHLITHPGTRHGDDIGHGDTSGTEAASETRLNLGLISGLDLVEAVTDECPAHRAHPGANHGSREGVADGFPHQGSDAGPGDSSDQRTLIGTIGRGAASAEG